MSQLQQDRRIIINSANSSSRISDTEILVNLGANYTGKRIHLNAFVCPNLFCNFREGEDDFSVRINGILISCVADQFIQASEFVQFFGENNSSNGTVKIQQLSVSQYLPIHKFQFYLNNVAINAILAGTGWRRLGFDIDGVSRGVHIAKRAYNYQGQKMIQIAIDGFSACQSSFGSSSFQLPITANFGSMIQYQSWREHTDFVNQLRIRLLDEDFMQLQTIRGNQPQKNQQGIDFIIVLTLHPE